MIGAHWRTLLTNRSGDQALATAECWLERAQAVLGAVAWEWDPAGGSHPAAGFALVHPDNQTWLKLAIAEAMLVQARKLEALGQLTGGVAHDFNNVLTAITGTYSLIRRRTDSPVVQDLVTRGEQAVERAANLTRQLLTFARRQDLCPAALDLSTVLQGAEDMVHHALLSNIHYTWQVPPDIWPVLADRHQLEVALLNLAINARDVMADGGTLAITARNLDAARPAHLPARDHVAIATRDTGTGIPPDIISRVTEPFFTTKEQGRGTGLGLAMVNGLAEQSGGCLRIESVPGSGTIIEIILPRADRPVVDGDGREESVPDSMLHGYATILVVDDDALVRATIAGLLRDLGYAVVEARNAEVAQGPGAHADPAGSCHYGCHNAGGNRPFSRRSFVPNIRPCRSCSSPATASMRP